LDEQSQRLTKVEETLKAHIANISASCSAKPAKEEVYDDSPSSSGTTSLNIYTVAPNLLTEAYVPWVPGSGPMPLQCVDVPKLKVNVEGKIFKCIVDTGAGPSLVVPENLGREILGRKYGTQAEVDNAIFPTDPRTTVSDCQGGDVKIVGQATVCIKHGSVSCNTPMLLLKANQKKMAPLIGVFGLKQLGVQVTTVDKQELLGHDISPEQLARMSVPKAPVVWPKTLHTQISLLKPCFAAQPLNLDPFHRGKFQMDWGSHRFVPNGIITRSSARQKVEFSENIPPQPPDAPIKIDESVSKSNTQLERFHKQSQKLGGTTCSLTPHGVEVLKMHVAKLNCLSLEKPENCSAETYIGNVECVCICTFVCVYEKISGLDVRGLVMREDAKSTTVTVDRSSRDHLEPTPKLTLESIINVYPAMTYFQTVSRNVSNLDFVGDLSAQNFSSNTKSQDLQNVECSIKNLNVCFSDFAYRKERFSNGRSKTMWRSKTTLATLLKRGTRRPRAQALRRMVMTMVREMGLHLKVWTTSRTCLWPNRRYMKKRKFENDRTLFWLFHKE
ncbi:MAG: hypothetical protein GY820_46020, partial [Gammaproteobacteria bacterium]|nr:hypothetical protein [Gammaproteobacteria bacterium]